MSGSTDDFSATEDEMKQWALPVGVLIDGGEGDAFMNAVVQLSPAVTVTFDPACFYCKEQLERGAVVTFLANDRLAHTSCAEPKSRVEAVRPDDSNSFDDETLVDIIAERFDRDPDPITRRDAAWLVDLAHEAIKTRTVKRESNAT